MEQSLRQWLPHGVVLAIAVVSAVCAQGLVDSAILVLAYCVPAVCGARVLQDAYLQWSRDRAEQQTRPWITYFSACWRSRDRALRVVAFCVVLAIVLVVVKKSDEGQLPRLLTLTGLLIKSVATAAVLATVFECSGSPKAELAGYLTTSYSDNAAWLFYLGYLEKSFGDDAIPFSWRMGDYLSSNGIENRDNTGMKLFITIPMKRRAVCSDKDLGRNDKSVSRERLLPEAAIERDRKYGELSIYNVTKSGRSYRLAIEQASPISTANRAVEDAHADFDEEDFETFANMFYETLKWILENKQAIRSQLELVPIYEADQIGKAVVERYLERCQEGQGGRDLQGAQGPQEGQVRGAQDGRERLAQEAQDGQEGQERQEQGARDRQDQAADGGQERQGQEDQGRQAQEAQDGQERQEREDQERPEQGAEEQQEQQVQGRQEQGTQGGQEQALREPEESSELDSSSWH